MDPNKQKVLDTVISQLDKTYGKGTVIKMSEDRVEDVEVIPTGSLTIDLALGRGGIPRGRITEIYGPESSGKTTVALHILASAQKQGGIVAFIDAEHALDPEYASAIGVDMDSLLVSQPDSGEQAFEIVEALVRSNAIDAIVIDSVAALVSNAELDGDMGDTHVGRHARMMSQALKKLAGYINKANVAVIFINQLRQKIGVVYGNPEVTTGGMALKFYSSVRLDVRRGEPIKSGSEVIGNRTRVKVVKSKISAPYREAEFDMIYGKGISREGELLDIAEKLGIVIKGGSWYSYGELRLGQGRDNAKEYIKSNPELYAEIEKKVMADPEALKNISSPKKGAKKAGSKKGAEVSVDISADDDE
ncbi:MAG: recombinase RecA [Clostridia bacterium]|nr:recombinase RecA [Clostridia bacterium]